MAAKGRAGGMEDDDAWEAGRLPRVAAQAVEGAREVGGRPQVVKAARRLQAVEGAREVGGAEPADGRGV